MTDLKALQLCKPKRLDDHCFSWAIICQELRKSLPCIKYQGYRWDVSFREIQASKLNTCDDVWLILTVSSLKEPLGSVSLHQPFKVSIIKHGDLNKELWSASTILSRSSFLPATTAWMNDMCLVVPGTVVLDMIGDASKCFLKLSFKLDADLKPEATSSLSLGTTNPAQYKELTKLADDFKALLLEPDDFDVTLDVCGKTFAAHKNILKARSPVFNRMFQHNMTEQINGLVEIPDCDATAFEVYLQYIYSGSFDSLTSSNVSNLYYIANKYGSDRLGQHCLEFMRNNLTVERFCDFVSAVLTDLKQSGFLEDSVKFFAENFKEIGESVAWRNFIKGNPLTANDIILKAYDKSVSCCKK